MQHIGNNFLKTVKLKILPGVVLPSGMWQVDISYVSFDAFAHMNHYNNTSFMVNGGNNDQFEILVGSDVRDITFSCRQLHHSSNVIHFSIRVDRLILLNLAHQLTK